MKTNLVLYRKFRKIFDWQQNKLTSKSLNSSRSYATRFFIISNQVAKALTLKSSNVKQLAKQPPTLKTLMQKNLLGL